MGNLFERGRVGDRSAGGVVLLPERTGLCLEGGN
jgi:hypothetical protein